MIPSIWRIYEKTLDFHSSLGFRLAIDLNVLPMV